LKNIQVWHSEKRYHDAVPVDLSRARHRRVGPDRSQELEKNPEAIQLSFFEAVKKSRRQTWKEEPLAFAREVRGDE